MNITNFNISNWQVKPSSNLLVANGCEKRIEPKVMSLLVYLAHSNGEVVSRELLLNNVWKHIVLDDALTNTIAQLRKALGDTKTPKKFIETIPKQGYRLIPIVEWEIKPEQIDEDAREDSQSDSSIQHKHQRRRDDSRHNKGSKRKLNLSWKFFLLLMLGSAISIFFINEFLFNKTNNSPSAQIKTVAVLPFDVYSTDIDVRHFADGLTEELTHQLAADPNLMVISRTSASKLRDKQFDIKELAETLGVQFIIEGSIRQSKDSLRTTVQLIDTNKDFHLWSKTFDNNKSELFLDTQIAIGEKVALLITNHKSKRVYSKRTHPRSADAYRLFLMAQSHMKLGKIENFEKGLAYYQQATEKAPDYALAYTGMAAAKLLLAQYKHTSFRKANIEATRLLEKAFSVEPDLAEAYAVRGLLNTYTQDYGLAEADYLKAISLNPGLRFTRHNYGYMLSLQDRTKEAIEQWKIAIEMDPLSPQTNYGLADSLIGIGEFEKGIKQFESCQEILPDSSGCFLGLASVYSSLGDKQNFLINLNISEKLTGSNNFWQQTIEAKYQLQQGNLENSLNLVERSKKLNNFSYHILKTELYLRLKFNQLDLFVDNISKLSLEHPNSSEINFLLGLSSYFQKNCAFSIIQYESAKKLKSKAFFSVWDWNEGISHQLNLAYCYKQTNNITAKKQTLAAYKSYIEQLPSSKHTPPGKIYNRARYYALMGKNELAKKQLKQIEGWSYSWLFNFDPILKDI